MAQNKAHFVRLFLALCREGTLKHCMQKSVSPSAAPGKRKLLDQVRDSVRFKHYSLRTEQAYTDWITRFIRYHHLRHPAEMGAEEVPEFLTDLAVQKRVAASTHNQALSALRVLVLNQTGQYSTTNKLRPSRQSFSENRSTCPKCIASLVE